MPILTPAVFAQQFFDHRLPGTQEDSHALIKGDYDPSIGSIGGFYGAAAIIGGGSPSEQAAFLNELQCRAAEQPLGIPLLFTEEAICGLWTGGATIFPEGITLGATFNANLIEHISQVMAEEAQAIGVHQITLVTEPYCDPRPGRNCETYSEDPYWSAQIAGALVRGTAGVNRHNGASVDAMLCHFPGASQTVSGMERGELDISERRLREIFLPVWREAISNGVQAVMASYSSYNGIPAHASPELFTDLLRTELGFDGVVYSEGGGFETLIYERVAADQQEAGELALYAGIDVNITWEDAFLGPLGRLVSQGQLSIELLDRAVRRVLTQKFRLGLFEAPSVDVHAVDKRVHLSKHQDLALNAARQGIVLLKNENILPLTPVHRRIAVIGPNATDRAALIGDRSSGCVDQVVSVLDAINEYTPWPLEVVHAQGCEVTGGDDSGIAYAAEVAQNATVAIVVVGDRMANLFANEVKATSGERLDSMSLLLPGYQQQLVEAVVATGVPTVLVLVNGRPFAIPSIYDSVDAIVEAWLPGEQGGRAITEVLCGIVNPSGRLPITIPRHAGQLPVTYDYKPSKRYWADQSEYIDGSTQPLYTFGFGLSYTTFTYHNLRVTPQITDGQSDITVTVTVNNEGKVTGDDVVLLYMRDVLSSVTTPERRLIGIERVVNLDPGASVEVVFTIQPSRLALLNRKFESLIEAGEYELMIGYSSEDIQQRVILQVTDDVPLEIA